MNIYISRKKLYFLVIVVSIIRLSLTSFQRATFLPDISMLDDFLMYQAAKSITAGGWLGAYGFMTIGKHMLFSVWLAFLNLIGVSYLFAGQLLYLLSSLAIVFAFSPMIKNKAYLFVFYLVTLFNPASFADFTLRVYRDNISVSFCLLVFASLIGFALRVEGSKTLLLWFYSILGGISFGASYLLREDGIWLIPFIITGLVICVVRVLKLKKIKVLPRLVALSMFGVFSLISISIYSYMNYRHYGRFIISDMTSKEFYNACGAMTRIVVPEDEFNPIVTLPLSSRQKLYEYCPTFAELEEYIESEYFHRMKKDVGNGVYDISGGGYYWAVRNAANLLGYYSDADTAKEFYSKLADEINYACDNNLIESTKPRSGINAPITLSRVYPTIKETLSGTLSVLLYRDIVCSPEPSIGSDIAIAQMEDYLNAKSFKLNKVYTDKNLIIVTVYSNVASVETSLVGLDGCEMQYELNNTTGSDIYVKELLIDGKDTLYTDYLRRYISFDDQLDSVLLQFRVKDEPFVVAPDVTEGMIDMGIFMYGIEYIGEDYILGDTASYAFLELWIYRSMRVLTFIYRCIMPIMFIIGLVCLFISLFNSRILKKADLITMFAVSVSILIMAFLRLAMVAFIEVSAFGIGTFPMYFAIAYPLFIVFSFTSVHCASDLLYLRKTNTLSIKT